MTSRQTLPEQAVRSRDSLVSALDVDGEPNTELVAQRARHLLRWKPNGADRDTWLHQVLPEQRHVRRTLRALRSANGSQTGKGAASAPDSGGQTQGSGQPRRRQTRRHRRT